MKVTRTFNENTHKIVKRDIYDIYYVDGINEIVLIETIDNIQDSYKVIDKGGDQSRRISNFKAIDFITNNRVNFIGQIKL
jgi:hypothetical protein